MYHNLVISVTLWLWYHSRYCA